MRWCICLFLYLHCCLPLFPQSRKTVSFEHFSIEDGLSQGTVYAILQDRRGFLWLGTEDGLNRYDGYSTTIYRYDDADPYGLSNSRVGVIIEDRDGVLWLGTREGLNRFNRENETFIHYMEGEAPGGLSSGYVQCICEGKSGELWIGAKEGGLNRMDTDGRTFAHYRHHPEEPGSLSADDVRAVLEDRSGVLWVGTENAGLNRFNREDETFTCFLHDPADSRSLSDDKIRCLYEDGSGALWIGTENGLNRFNREEENFIRFKKDDRRTGSLSHNNIISIFEDSGGEMWVGTYGGGLNRFDRNTGVFTAYRHDPASPDSLSNDHVCSIFQDRAGILWFGTERGLNKLAPRQKFVSWSVSPDNSGGLIDEQVWAIHKDADDSLWIGTDGGLTRLNRKKGEARHWSGAPGDPHGLNDERVLTLYEDSSGILWIGTQYGGLNRFDREKNRFTHHTHNPDDPDSLNDNCVYAVREDSEAGFLWVGTEKGLNRLNLATGRFTRWGQPDASDKADAPKKSNAPGNIGESRVTTILVDRGGTPWIGTLNGLNRWNREFDTFDHWTRKPGESHHISNNNIIYLHEDAEGVLWVGTGWGLNKFDGAKETFTHYSMKDGLPNNKIYGILEDKTGRLWLSTNRGISRFNPLTGEFRNYDAHDGLQSNEFNGNSCFAAADGEMFFGGMYGFSSFYPEEVVDSSYIPPIVLTDLRVFNKSIAVRSGHLDALEVSLPELKRVVLTHRDKFFSFAFAALDYTVPVKNRYRYKMDRFDKEWIETDAHNRLASYTNLGAGHYTFRVTGTNNDGIWNDEGVSLAVIITPPFWKTWWFRGLLVLCFILVVLGGHLHRTRRLRRQLDEQRRAQATLRIARNLAEFRRAEVEQLMGAISALLIAVDAYGNIFQWNAAAAGFFDFQEADISGRSFETVLEDYISAEKLQEILEKGLGAGLGEPTRDFEIPVNLRGKGTRILLSAVNPISDRSGKLLGFLLLAEDITHRREEERQRFLSQKMESLGQLAANIAHEIQNPLQFIGNNGCFVSDSMKDFNQFHQVILECLEDIERAGLTDIAEKVRGKLTEYDIEYILQEAPKASDQIVSGVTRLSGIIRAMREYAHPGRGIMEKTDIHKMLETTLMMLRNKRKKILDIETDFHPSLPRVACYPGELSQVFMNLLINAADAIQEKGKLPGLIKISTGPVDGDDERVKVVITDNGCGIPDHIKDDVFHPFFTTKGVEKGTGQGLAMAHKIVTEKHKGKLFFESRSGEGTVFHVYLPIEGES